MRSQARMDELRDGHLGDALRAASHWLTERAYAIHARATRSTVDDAPARRYLRRGLSVDDFFAELGGHHVRYAVLRWFESLPEVEAGEDIDILVADDDVEFVHSLLLDHPTGPDSQKFDVYSVSGVPGSDFDGIPYYPPRFARSLLDTGVLLRDRYRVPDAAHHLDSLAYHAAYHKGYASGLRRDATAPWSEAPASDHDYAAWLSRLARDLGVPLEPTLDGLDAYLSARGLRPPLDTLERLRGRDAWIAELFESTRPDVDPLWDGLVVFVVRERADELAAAAAAELNTHGFEIIDVVALSEEQRERAGHHLRGGNWERGPFPVSGGRPAVYVVAYDVAPRFTSTADGTVNARIPEAKEMTRLRLLSGVAPDAEFNPVHSSDNPAQALDYLGVLGDDRHIATLESRVRRLVDACAMPFPVLRYLSAPGGSRRSRVALVEHPVHGESVCKVFRPGATRYFERELAARRTLGNLPEIPELLDHGENWLLAPVYGDDRSHVVRPLPTIPGMDQLRLGTARALARFAVRLHEQGLFMLDLAPQNLRTDPVSGLKVLDLEFVQAYADGRPPHPADAYTFRGIPAGERGRYDVPFAAPLTEGVPNSAFHPGVTGMPLRALIAPPRRGERLIQPLRQRVWYARFHIEDAIMAGRARFTSTMPGRKVRAVVRRFRAWRGRTR